MAAPQTWTFLPNPDATEALAVRLAPHLRAGDTLLLEGPIGAGKTAFARAVITFLQKQTGVPPEDVPSPTFTLVQTYAAGSLDIWHADLYRLSDPQEVMELGLEDAFETALCLVEWPDRLGDDRPIDAASLCFTPQGAGRRLDLRGTGPLVQRLVPFLQPVTA
ncbi:MAG: tRNA (adenosine(37)-N6)-threonylcarbamoyltransferase complex ATPase subunit type 1 TsaE [Pseudomonadota bacterium]